MTKKAITGFSLTRSLETQASDGTGFRNQLPIYILELDESKTAYDTTAVEIPLTRCYFVASLITWADFVNKGLLDYLEKIGKGECVEVLNVDYSKFSSQNYWLRGRMKSDMMTYGDIPLHLDVVDRECKSSAELYEIFEEIVCEMTANFNKVKITFDHLELYAPVIQQMEERYDNPLIVYEYALMKEEYLEPTLTDYLNMQVTVCMDLLHSGMLNDVLSISNEEVEKVDEAKLHKMQDPHYKTPDNLKELWAKLRKFIDVKEELLIVPRRDLLLKYVLKHKNMLTVDHIRAVFRFDKLLKLIHQDMVKMKPELTQYLTKHEEANTFGIVNSLTRLMQQDWFKEFRTDPKYDDAWIEKFLNDLMKSEWCHVILQEWENARKRPKLKCKIIGAMKDASILKSDYQTIAEKLDMGNELPAETHAKYMGYGKAQPYFEWICDYVKA